MVASAPWWVWKSSNARPVLPIVGYDTLEDALDWINMHPHPLALYIFAEDRKEQTRVLDRTQSGGVTVNGTLLHIAQEGLLRMKYD